MKLFRTIQNFHGFEHNFLDIDQRVIAIVKSYFLFYSKSFGPDQGIFPDPISILQLKKKYFT